MTERFLILCREPNEAAENLRMAFSGLGAVELVSDTPTDQAVWYPDEAMQGYRHLSGWSQACRPVTAWDRAWMHLNLTSGKNPAPVWLVEDDVAGNPEDFSRVADFSGGVDADLSALEFRLMEEDPGWPHWHVAADRFTHPARSFNPLCRLNARLVGMVLEFRRCHGRFVFMEALFASLVAEHGLSYLDWQKEPETASLFDSFRFRPEIGEAGKGIHHPVKDPELHRAICSGLGKRESS